MQKYLIEQNYRWSYAYSEQVRLVRQIILFGVVFLNFTYCRPMATVDTVMKKRWKVIRLYFTLPVWSHIIATNSIGLLNFENI